MNSEIHVVIPEAREYVTLCGKKDLVEVIKMRVLNGEGASA